MDEENTHGAILIHAIEWRNGLADEEEEQRETLA